MKKKMSEEKKDKKEKKMENYAYFVFPRSLSRTEIVCGFTNSVLTDRRMKLSPYSTNDNSPALKIKQTFGFSK